MKKFAMVLIGVLLIIVGATANAAAENNPFIGAWTIPWDDGEAKIQVSDRSSVPGTVVATYTWDGNNGFCTQVVKISDSTLVLKWGETIIVLCLSADGTLTAEKCSTTRLQRVAE